MLGADNHERGAFRRRAERAHQRQPDDPQRRSASASLPETTFRLADSFRPRPTRSQLTKRADGRYNEPYSAIIEQSDAVSVLCVQRTPDQVLVRHMPEQEWQRLLRQGDEVHPGEGGVTSLHLVAPAYMSTLPPEAAPVGRPPSVAEYPPSPAPSSQTPVFDYFVAPESRLNKLLRDQDRSIISYLRLRTQYTQKELERIAREDRRAALSVERREIFLRQYQRDMSHRLSGTPLYTMGRELPEELVQLFFMFGGPQSLPRYSRSWNVPPSLRPDLPSSQRAAPRRGGGRYLFTVDGSFGDRLPFAGQAPADGFVVVTVGPTADASSSLWRSWDPLRRCPKEHGENDEPFVPCNYSSAEYVTRAGASDKMEDDAHKLLVDAEEEGRAKRSFVPAEIASDDIVWRYACSSPMQHAARGEAGKGQSARNYRSSCASPGRPSTPSCAKPRRRTHQHTA